MHSTLAVTHFQPSFIEKIPLFVNIDSNSFQSRVFVSFFTFQYAFMKYILNTTHKI